MSREEPAKRDRRAVPVNHRAQFNQPVGAASELRTPRHRGLAPSEIAILLGVAILALMVIAFPLKNYFDQRSDITKLQASISAKEEEKERLLGELEKNNSQAYRDEQIRRRLGAVGEGETPFRIIDPSMTTPDGVSSVSSPDGEEAVTWYRQLWDSLTDPHAPLITLNGDTPGEEPDSTISHLPLEPLDAPPAPPAQ